MKRVEAFARILTDQGKDAVGVTVNLEVYTLSSRRWVQLATAKSTTRGVWTVKANNLQAGAFYAPMLRLTEPGSPAPRVLSQGGKLSYNPTSQVLSVDFGLIEQLADTAYPLSASNSRFSRIKQTVAGLAKRANLSSAILVRNLNLASSGSLGAGGVNLSSNTGNSTAATTGKAVLLDTYSAEVLKLRSNEAQLQSQISQKDQLLATRQQALGQANNRISELEAQFAKSQADAAKLKTENENLNASAKRKAPIHTIAANIGTQVETANRQLQEAKQGYRFGRIELNLRGSVSDDGQSMALPNLVELGKLQAGTTLPSIKLELLPNRQPAEAGDSVPVPDLSGLTESAVRRLLQAAGLRLERVSKSLGQKPKVPIGQAIQQSPRPGASLTKGERVLVVFSAP